MQGLKSGWQDSNLRPPAPKAGAITGLRYTPKLLSQFIQYFLFKIQNFESFFKLETGRSLCRACRGTTPRNGFSTTIGRQI